MKKNAMAGCRKNFAKAAKIHNRREEIRIWLDTCTLATAKEDLFP
jgi:hypothetical protein